MPEVWPFPADESLVDSYEFLTDVMRTRTTEKRVIVRQNPQRYISMSHILTDETYALYKAIAKRVSSFNEVLLPLWVDAVPLRDVAIGQDEFFFDTEGFDFSTQVVLWSSVSDFEILDIDVINSGSIVVDVGASKDRATALIIPLREAITIEGFSISRNSFNYHSGSQKFKIKEDDQIGDSFSTTEHFGVPVIPLRPTRNNSLSEKIITTTVEVENGSGPFKVFDLLDFVDFYQTVEFKFSARSQIRTIRDFVCSLKGKSETFWLPSFFNEITLIGNANTTATVKKVMPSTEYVGKHVFIQMKDGTKYTRKISSSSPSGDNILLTFSASIGTTISSANVQQFCFMTLVRSDSDIFEFNYDTGLNSLLSFPVLEVPELL
jgi:hypothetical protein